MLYNVFDVFKTRKEFFFMKSVEIIKKGYTFSEEKVVSSFEMGISTHKYECDCEFEKNSQFYYKGEWYMIVYQYHTQSDVVIPCNVYARYSSLCNSDNEVFNADFIYIDGKPLPEYKGKLKSAFAIC